MNQRTTPLLILLIAIAAVCYVTPTSTRAEPFVAVTSQGILATYDIENPANLIRGVPISFTNLDRLPEAASLVALEFVSLLQQPPLQQLYAVDTANRVLTVNPFTGSANEFKGPGIPINGTNFGLAFDPSSSILRIVSTADQNLRVNPNTGQPIAVDGNLAYAGDDSNFGTNPSVMSAAFVNEGQAGSILHVIDSRLDVLAFESPPDSGLLHTLGPLGVDVGEIGGLSISPATGIAYAALLPSNSTHSVLYRINLQTGAAINLGEIGGGLVITAFAVPEPAALALALVGIMIIGIRHLRVRCWL